MKLNVRGHRKACPVSTSATLCTLMVALSLAAWPTHAYAEQSPTLTVHVTAGTSGSGSNNDSGQILPDNQRPASAGPGFIYELVQLDPSLVTAVPGTQNERTRTILSHPNAYILSGAQSSLGESDANGDITNNGLVQQGSWISGGTISAGSIAGGSPAVLSGMQSNPTY